MSYALVLALAGGSLGILVTSPDVDETLRQSPEMLDVRDYVERNPEVEVSPRLARWIGEDEIRALRERHEQRRAAGAVARLSERMRDKSQRKFDALQKAAFASLEELPAWRFGVAGSESSFLNTFLHLATHETTVAVGVSIVFFAVAALTLEVAWGSLLFGGFCLLLPFLSRFAAGAISGDNAVPWIGPSAAIAALLGAYSVRGLRGFVVPPWVLVPVWIFCEYVFVRDLGVDSFDTTPVLIQATCFVFGGVVAAGIWITNLEERVLERAKDTPELLSNPVLEQALEERTHGNPDVAFEMLEQELKRRPGNHDVAVALWETSAGSERARRAVPALLASVRDGLQKGRRADAVALWLGISSELGVPKSEGNLLVRMGEALIAQEQHQAGLEALAAAVDGPRALSPMLAMRVARSARDLDASLAVRAAAIALADGQLGEAERLELETLQATTPVSASPPAPSPGAARPASAAATAPAPDPLQDPHAIAADAFAELPQGEYLAAASPEQSTGVWEEPGLIEDLTSELPDEEQDSGFDWSGLQDEADATAPDVGAAKSDADDDTDVHLDAADASAPIEVAPAAGTPAPAPEDLGAGGLSAEALGVEALAEDGPAAAALTAEAIESVGLSAEALGVEAAALAAPAPAASPAAGETPAETPEITETTETLEPDLTTSLRRLRARSGVPLELGDEGISIDVGQGKTVVPYELIEALAAAAVNGLAERPVLVVDLVLNWLASSSEPLKVIRIRSDAFDPRKVMPGSSSALDALRAMLDRILTRSSGVPLPSRDAALGNPFETCADLESYARDVLRAE